MDIKTCRTCGKLFQSRGNNQCPECIRATDEKFVVVRNYILDNPQATMQDICEENDIEEDAVLRWIREGRLLVGGRGVSFKCAGCGKTISAGNYCIDCGDRIKGQVDAAARDMQRAISKMQQGRSGIHTEGLRRDNR